MESASKTGKSQVGGSKFRPASGSKFAGSVMGRRQPPSGMAKSEKSTIYGKNYQIFNEMNVDVTPLPLIDSAAQKKVAVASIERTVSEFPSIIGMTGTSSFAGGPFGRSVFNTTVQYEVGEDYSDQDITSSWRSEPGKYDTQETEEVLNEDELDKPVTVYLEETDTELIFELFCTCVMAGTPEEEIVIQRNKLYKTLVNSRAGNDRYVSKEMNTFNDERKLKYVQTNPVNFQNTGVMASNWDMYDSYRGRQPEVVTDSKDEATDEDFLEKPSDSKINSCHFESDSGKKSLSDDTSRSSSLTSQHRHVSINDKSTDDQTKVSEKVLQSDRFKGDLFMMERIINLNTYQAKLALYRDLPVSWGADTLSKETALGGPNLLKLWSFVSPLTKGRTVTCMAWNPLNLDLIAVGYGQLEFNNQKSGLICCWSLKNPEYPERVFPTEYGVTAVNFSTHNSNLLAVGFYNGCLAIYDLASNADEPVLDNLVSSSKHTAPVGQVRWIEKETSSDVSEKVEILVSISKDGRVTSWSIRKGFESTDLMRLRRVGMSAKVAGKSREKKVEMFISRYDGGMCLDFHPIETNIYLVGTEEAYIHKCSCSYNEQYLDTYVGHLAPVYCVVWSPFLPDVFLSCGADWTVRLWHQDRLTPILTFSSSIVLDSKHEASRLQKSLVQLTRTGEKTVYRLKNVFAVDWSPRSSTMFACVNEEGVEVWDLSKNILDPIIHYPPKDAPRGPTPTQITFAKNSDCVFVGDDEGNVVVLQLHGVSPPPDPDKQKQTLIQILNSSLASQLNAGEEQCNLFKSNSETGSSLNMMA